MWKTDIYEDGVTKIDHENYNYNLNYTGCEDKETVKNKENKIKTEQLAELKKLRDQGILTQKEFEKAKKKIFTK